MNFSNMRRNGIVGIIEDDFLDHKHSLHFSEWWNGEGFDLNFDDEKVMSLHISQLRMLVVMLLATEYVDIDECKEAAFKLVLDSAEKERQIIKMRNELRDWNV